MNEHRHFNLSGLVIGLCLGAHLADLERAGYTGKRLRNKFLRDLFFGIIKFIVFLILLLAVLWILSWVFVQLFVSPNPY